MIAEGIKRVKREEKSEHLRSCLASKCESEEKARPKKCPTLLLIIPFNLTLSYFPVFFALFSSSLFFLSLHFSFRSDFCRLAIESSRKSFA